jgi:hypothetical protein
MEEKTPFFDFSCKKVRLLKKSKREICTTKRWGKCAESEAVDFEIVL